MKVCTFLGHDDVYDTNVYEKMIEAITEIVEQEERVDFWIYGNESIRFRKETFNDYCFEAVEQVKQQNPTKPITITKIVKYEDEDAYNPMLDQYKIGVPPCFIDTILPAPSFPNPRKNDVTVIPKKIRRWVIEKSDIVICYLYCDFHDTKSSILKGARKQGKIIYDISDPKTAAYISREIRKKDDKIKSIMVGLSEEKTQSELARQLNLTTQYLRKMMHRCSFELRKQTIRRMLNLREREQYDKIRNSIPGAVIKEQTVSVLNTGTISSEKKAAFIQAVEYILYSGSITEVDILNDNVCSEYADILAKIARRFAVVQTVGITHFEEQRSMTREEWHNAASPLCPPYHAVYNIDTYTDDPKKQMQIAVHELLRRSKYCICSLDDPELAEIILSDMDARRTTLLLDISKTNNQRLAIEQRN